MGKTVVITQSNYLPWRGYFDLLRSADEVVLLEAVQYTRRDWRNRNLIKTANGLKWITIPIATAGRYLQAIDETRIADGSWVNKHIRAIEAAYVTAPFYSEVAPWMFNMLESVAAEPKLSRVNQGTLAAVCDWLGISIKLRPCDQIIERDRLQRMEPTERIIAIAKGVGADRCLTGPAARAYLDLNKLHAATIQIEWMSYENYPPYPQLWGGFEPAVSIVDLLMNTGPNALSHLTRSRIRS